MYFFNAGRKLCDLVIFINSPSEFKTGAITDREISHLPKIVTAHLLIYLVDRGIGFSKNSCSS